MLYAITVGKKWGLIRNKRKAIRIAKREGGKVYARPSIPEISAWDWPTYAYNATRIY
ncbi:MAG: hypothetical protein JRE28_10320 [Deltaproteobacteria bacterium]|nr:hypothetical protein [Deltaproteobacteria bacterium]